MYEDDRCFVNPNDSDNAEDAEEMVDHEFDDEMDHNLEETNTNANHLNFYISAESEIIVPSANMLRTIKEECEEMLATTVIPFRNEAKEVRFSEAEMRARQKLERLGLN